MSELFHFEMLNKDPQCFMANNYELKLGLLYFHLGIMTFQLGFSFVFIRLLS